MLPLWGLIHRGMIDKAIEKVYQCFRVIMTLGLIILVLYGAFWILKTASFYLFYKDMVRETIVEMVDQDSLR